MFSLSKENFLKQIYKQEENGIPNASASHLAMELNVSNAAITDMARKLSNAGYVNHLPYKGLSLTKEGRIAALNVVRKHRLWELFLIKTLNMNWSEVHDEAENLEHFTSDKLIDKIDEYLGFPTIDPHGAYIPDRNGKITPYPERFSLSEAKLDKEYIFSRIFDESTEILKYLNRIGLKLKSTIRLLEKFSIDESCLILFEGKEIILSKKVSEQIFVEHIN